jgi:hypothetical protein
VRSYSEFVLYINNYGVPAFISFDHDLAYEHYPIHEQNVGPDIPYNKYLEGTGYDCALYLVSNDLELPSAGWAVHSMNPVGKRNIEFLLNGYERFLKQNKHEG